jgi:hypothetical protein
MVAPVEMNVRRSIGFDGISNSFREEGSQGETLSTDHGFKIGVRLDSIMHVRAGILWGNAMKKRTTAFFSGSDADSGADSSFAQGLHRDKPDSVFACNFEEPFEIEEDAC